MTKLVCVGGPCAGTRVEVVEVTHGEFVVVRDDTTGLGERRAHPYKIYSMLFPNPDMSYRQVSFLYSEADTSPWMAIFVALEVYSDTSLKRRQSQRDLEVNNLRRRESEKIRPRVRRRG